MSARIVIFVVQRAPSFGGGCHDLKVETLSAPLESASRTAMERLRHWNSVPYRCAPGEVTNREHRAEFRLPCSDCSMTGTKRGCKKKRCPGCDGIGSLMMGTLAMEGAR